MNYIIYKVCCKNKEITDFYIGKTNNLSNRIRQHKMSCNNINDKEHNKLLYLKIRENGGLDNWDFEILENIENVDNKFILKRERYFIDTLIPTLNKNRPFTTDEEKLKQKLLKDRKYENKPEVKEKRKAYNLEHRDKLIEYKRQYRLNNKEQISIKNKNKRLQIISDNYEEEEPLKYF